MDQQLRHELMASHLPASLSEFASVNFPPTDERPVLAIRHSSSNCCEYELITARYMPEFRPLNPWVDINGDAITDSGQPVIGWRNAFRWLQPR